MGWMEVGKDSREDCGEVGGGAGVERVGRGAGTVYFLGSMRRLQPGHQGSSIVRGRMGEVRESEEELIRCPASHTAVTPDPVVQPLDLISDPSQPSSPRPAFQANPRPGHPICPNEVRTRTEVPRLPSSETLRDLPLGTCRVYFSVVSPSHSQSEPPIDDLAASQGLTRSCRNPYSTPPPTVT